MFKVSEENNRCSIVILIFLLTGFSFINSTQLSFTEGGHAEILFQYNQKQDLDIELRSGDRPPFYQHGEKEERGLSPGQNKRFSVEIEKHSALGVSYHMFLVRVKIENVSREDAGTYTCIVYRNGVILDENIKQVGLNIEFPPGKAECVLGPSHVDTTNEIWAHLRCTASIGSRLGIIECYQNGERVPPWTRPIQNRTTLMQTLWIRWATPVFCCSSTFEKEGNLCSCKDFVKDFSQISEKVLDYQPCPSATVSGEFPTTEHHENKLQTPHEHPSTSAGDRAKPMDNGNKTPVHSTILESGLALSLILVFTLLNTLGISVMIATNTFTNHIKIKQIGNLLKTQNKKVTTDATKENITQDVDQKENRNLRNRNNMSKY